MQSGSPQRGDHANPARHNGQRALAGRVKQAFSLQLCFNTQKLFKQRALSGALQAVHNQLQITTLLVHAQLAAHLHQLPIARRKVHGHGRAAKHGTAQLPGRIFDAEVAMTAACTRKTRDLTAHRHGVEACLEAVGNRAAQRANVPDAGLSKG
ncbi:hypothetical protein D3C72_1679240 [compost metagenome]